MSSLLARTKKSNFVGKNKSIYLIRSGNSITLYCAFIVKPHKKITLEDNKKWKRYSDPKDEEETPTILDILNQIKKLRTAVHRFFLPGNVKRKNIQEQQNKNSKDFDPILN